MSTLTATRTIAVGAWTGPVGVLFMDAVAGGGGFLAAALLAWRNRS